MLGEIERERDDALAVLAGVAVVGFDHVAEDERGAAVGARELEHALEAPAALPGEYGEQTEQRDHGYGGQRGPVDALGGEQAGRRQCRVDAVDPAGAYQGGEPAVAANRDVERAGGEVDRELRR